MGFMGLYASGANIYMKNFRIRAEHGCCRVRVEGEWLLVWPDVRLAPVRTRMG